MKLNSHKQAFCQGAGEKKKIVRVLGGKLCSKKWRLCGNCAGVRNRVNKQIFDYRAPQKNPDMVEFLDK